MIVACAGPATAADVSRPSARGGGVENQRQQQRRIGGDSSVGQAVEQPQHAEHQHRHAHEHRHQHRGLRQDIWTDAQADEPFSAKDRELQADWSRP